MQTASKPFSLAEFLALPETKPANEFIDGYIYCYKRRIANSKPSHTPVRKSKSRVAIASVAL